MLCAPLQSCDAECSIAQVTYSFSSHSAGDYDDYVDDEDEDDYDDDDDDDDDQRKPH